MDRRYSELIVLPTFKERFEYLKMRSNIGEPTFGGHRQLNQLLYTSARWRRTRDKVIIRDYGCDLAIRDYNIVDGIIVHHINPISVEDIKENTHKVFDLENLICTSFNTHNAIHFGGEIKEMEIITRSKNDTSPWLK